MTKTRRTKQRERLKQDAAHTDFDLDMYVDKYMWLLLPVLTLLYYWFSVGSTGFYQDDEIGHYRNIRQFWGDPFSIMGNQPKPGWKILMVVPGLFGFVGVALAHCFVAALTAVMTWKLGKAMKLRNSTVAALLLAMQPLYVQLAFRSYSEIPAALFVVLSLLFYYREQWVLAALTSSYVFSLRQEFALVSIGLGIVFLFRKQWIPFLVLAWTPLTLALIGWAVTGNMMWLIDDMTRIGLKVDLPRKHLMHYFEVYIYMVGPVVLTMFVLGYFRQFFPLQRWREHISKHGFFFFTFTIIFVWSVLSAWEVLDFGANPGHWRYLLSIAPLTAIYGVMGLNIMFAQKDRQMPMAILVTFAALALLFLSRDTTGIVMIDQPRYDHSIVVVAILFLYALFSWVRVVGGGTVVTFLLIGGVTFTLYAEKPRKLDPVARMVKDMAEWYLQQPEELQQRPLYGNHVLFRYFADIDINDKQRDLPMFIETLEEAPIGAVAVWDSHYGFNQFGGDVPLEYFHENPSFKLLNQSIAPDRSFGILVFEKVVPSPDSDHRILGDEDSPAGGV